jgi:hypothetical protein
MRQVAAQPPPYSSPLVPVPTRPEAVSQRPRAALLDGASFSPIPRRWKLLHLSCSSHSRGCWRHPRCRASIRTLNGPLWARCTLGSDLNPGSTTAVMDPGCWALPSNRRSLKDQPVIRSHPNKAVDVAFNQISEKQRCFERSTTDLRSSAVIQMLWRIGYLSCSCLGCPRSRDVAQRLVDLAAGPQPVQ